MRGRGLDLVLTASVAMVACLLVLGGAGGAEKAVMGVILGVPLVVVLPGYALSRCLLPDRLGAFERSALAVGLSLALSAVGGLLLHLTWWGLTRTTWSVSLAGVTVVTSISGLLLRRGSVGESGEEADRVGRRLPILRTSLLMGASLLIAVGAVWLSVASADSQARDGFTELWLVSGGTPEFGASADLGARSAELQSQSYYVELTRNGRVTGSWRFVLLPGEAWTEAILLRAGEKIQAELFREGIDTDPYRRVSLSIPNDWVPEDGAP
jgi:hypothetical protein